MPSDQNAKSKKGRDVYTLYRDKLRMPQLTKRQINEIRANLRAVAHAVCEHVWRKKFY